MTRERLGDVVVLLPGILGSALERDGKEVWAPTPGAIGRALFTLGRSVSGLRLDTDPIDVDDVDGVVATRLMPDVHIVPGPVGHRRILRRLGDAHEHVRARPRPDVRPLPLRLATRQPRRRTATRRRRRPRPSRAAQGARRRQTRPHRSLDGRPGGPLLPGVPRRLEGHPDAHHVRHPVPGLVERGRLHRQRVQEEDRSVQGRRPQRAAAIAHLGVPAAADLPLHRRGHWHPRAGRRVEARGAPRRRPRPCCRARLPPRHRAGRRRPLPR